MIGRFLIAASGADAAMVREQREQRRYAIYGGLVLFTTGMATLSMAWAIGIAVDAPAPVAAIVALFWGFGILHIDQWLVSSHLEQDRLIRRLWMLVPRLAIAVPMGLTITWFVMLGIASKEIDEQLQSNQLDRTKANGDVVHAMHQKRIDELKTERTWLTGNVEKTRRDARDKLAAYNDELNGSGGTGRPGNGQNAQRRLRESNAANEEFQNASDLARQRVPVINEQIEKIEQQVDQERGTTLAAVSHSDGLFARRAALEQVLARESGSRYLFRLLEVVFVVVDVAPAVAKVFSPASMVDLAYRDRKRAMLADSAARLDVDDDAPELVAVRSYVAARRAESIRAAADTRYGRPAQARAVTSTPWRPY